jgi:cytosine/adenosine deaminase-related metal-dependent hydrolase
VCLCPRRLCISAFRIVGHTGDARHRSRHRGRPRLCVGAGRRTVRSLLLADCRLAICMNDGKSELLGAWIGIEASQIVYLDTAPPARAFDDTLDCSRLIALPGLVNTHHHLYQTLTRGFPKARAPASSIGYVISIQSGRASTTR